MTTLDLLAKLKHSDEDLESLRDEVVEHLEAHRKFKLKTFFASNSVSAAFKEFYKTIDT